MISLGGRRLAVFVLVGLLVAAIPACSSSGGDQADKVDLGGAGHAHFHAVGNTEAVTITGARPGTHLRVVGADGTVQHALFAPDGHKGTAGTVDHEGNLVFDRIAPGHGYRVVADTGGTLAASEPLTVGGVLDHPPQSIYDRQRLHEGLNYITTRDGTKLSALVHFPARPLPGTPPGGPYPTVINYSGYDTSNPAGSGSSIAPFAEQYGYATVSVNVRGTGCSGGTFSFFEPVQQTDGYDAVEAVAAQSWVAHHRPGLIGISYAGISQLYVASTRPPHLAAIAPMSVLDSVYPAILYPGGIYNDGFARQWSQNVADGARPLGQGWEQGVIDDGGPIGRQCAANQHLRSQNPDLAALARAYPFYDPTLGDPITPSKLTDRIKVPIFLTGSWQDEQTGGHFPALLSHFRDSPDVHVSMTNGTHGDSLIPANTQRWWEFLDFYVARRIPKVPPIVRAAAAPVFASQFGEGHYTIPPDRFTSAPSYAAALARYKADPEIRVMFENGSATSTPGVPGATFTETYDSWPPKNVNPTAWYLQPGGGLAPERPTVGAGDRGSATSFVYDAAHGHQTSAPSGFSFLANQAYDWKPVKQGSAVSYVSTPLDHQTVMVGPASADLWVESTQADTDLQVTISEVRPDGKEIYIQNGWLRASHRALDQHESTTLRPIHTDLRSDAAPLPHGKFTAVRVEMFPFAYAFRKGSRIRVTVDSPGGNRPLWTFATLHPHGRTIDTVAQSSVHASRIVLPVLPGRHHVPAAYPRCTALRGEPCRRWVPIDNTAATD